MKDLTILVGKTLIDIKNENDEIIFVVFRK